MSFLYASVNLTLYCNKCLRIILHQTFKFYERVNTVNLSVSYIAKCLISS